MAGDEGPEQSIEMYFVYARGLGQRRQWQPTPVLLSGKSHGQGSLVGYSPWGHKKSLGWFVFPQKLTLRQIGNLSSFIGS